MQLRGYAVKHFTLNLTFAIATIVCATKSSRYTYKLVKILTILGKGAL